MRDIYLDNGATTRVRDEVIELMDRLMREDYGNPSSKHHLGFVAEKYLKEAAERIAGILNVRPDEIVFNSGATEGNNTAIIGTALSRKALGKHIITSSIEHAGVYNPMLYLEKQGYDITFLPVDNKGKIDLEALRGALRPDTILVSTMWVNNEIGTIEDIKAIGEIIKSYNSKIYYHVDGVQGFGKLPIHPEECNIDMLTVSAHKIHGPKGAGFLYMKRGINVNPLILGGGQQKDRRSGTENVPGYAGMGLAAKLIYDDYANVYEHSLRLKDELIAGLNKLEAVTVLSEVGEKSAPHIVNAVFKNVRAEVLLHALEEKHIYVSSGSACSSNHPGVSGTLKAIGLPDSLLDSSLRFSFGMYNEEADVTYTLEALKGLLPTLRKYYRR